MLVDIEKLKYLLSEARNYKDEIKDSYNETFKYTDPFFEIKDSGSREKSSRRKIDFVILKSQNFLCNFIMTSIFSRNGSWATLKTNPTTFKQIAQDEGENVESAIESIDKVMEKNSNTVYEINETTNYYTETAKAIKDCIRVGTGIRKIVELASTSKPFTYEYVNMDNFYFLEDSFGKPTITFKEHTQKNIEELKDIFGHIRGFTPPSELSVEGDLKKKINVIESVVPDFRENNSTVVYYHSVHTANFDELILEEVLEYHPYRVFRWGTDTSNPWGVGIGRENLDLFSDLEKYKEKRLRHIDKIVDPPLNFKGNIDLIYKVSLEAGAKNYAGDGASPYNDMGVSPIDLGTNLLPIEQDIQNCRASIREVYMAQPLGDVMETKNRSATEMSLRHEMFRKEFSGAYELLNTELLEPTFMDAYIILQKKGLLEGYEDVASGESSTKVLEFSQVVYVNELTKNAGRERVMDTLSWYQLNAQISDENRRKYLIKVAEFNKWSADMMRVPKELIPTQEEIETEIARDEQILRLQQLGSIQNEALTPQVQEIAGGDYE